MQKEPRTPEKREDYSHREISLWLDEYDDIFSDFDPRPYSERNISEDFTDEMKKISQEAGSSVGHIKLLLPQQKRDNLKEEVIIKRLHLHLLHTYREHAHDVRNLKIRSIVFVVVAMVLMVCATYLSSIAPVSFIRRALFVIAEPAGWFLMWTGLDTLFNISRKQMPEVRFYEKVAKSQVHFESIDKKTKDPTHKAN